MYVKHLCEKYIQHWEKESIKHNFCLRFPNGCDFISFLYSLPSDKNLTLLLSTTKGHEMLEDHFHSYLMIYIRSLRESVQQQAA